MIFQYNVLVCFKAIMKFIIMKIFIMKIIIKYY